MGFHSNFFLHWVLTFFFHHIKPFTSARLWICEEDVKWRITDAWDDEKSWPSKDAQCGSTRAVTGRILPTTAP